MNDRYSALKMEGKPLYEYARNGLPLPRPIEARKVNVHSLELVDWQEAAPRTPLSLSKDSQSSSTLGHRYSWPEKRLDTEQVAAMEGVRKLISEALDPEQHECVAPDIPEPAVASSSVAPVAPVTPVSNMEETKIPPVFTLKMTVSSGTYVRSIVHDLAHAVGSAAHVVSLARTRQSDFAVGSRYPACRGHSEEATTSAEGTAAAPAGAAGVDEDAIAGGCIPWEVFEKAIKLREEQPEYEVPAGEREDWEEVLLTRLHAP
jgi:tRNA pseudouridine55 synthase